MPALDEAVTVQDVRVHAVYTGFGAARDTVGLFGSRTPIEQLARYHARILPDAEQDH